MQSLRVHKVGFFGSEFSDSNKSRNNDSNNDNNIRNNDSSRV